MSSVAPLQPLLTLVLASLVVMGSPGPSTLSALAVSASFGPRRAIAYVGGLMAGAAVVLVAVATGVVAMLLSLPALANTLAYASAGYLLYLSFRIATAAPIVKHAADTSPPSFAAGLALAVANAKAWFGIAAVFAASTLVDGAGVTDAVLKVVVLTIMIVAIHLGWLFAGAALAGFLRDPKVSRIANVVFAVILAATAIAPLLR